MSFLRKSRNYRQYRPGDSRSPSCHWIDMQPFFASPSLAPLSVSEDDGIIIYGRRPAAVQAVRPARSNWPERVRKELKRMARLINGPPEPATRRDQPFYHGHASGLRIAGIACIHRAPQP